MAKAKNAMEIFQVLDKSNCKQCGLPTCLAFAGAVFTGRKPLTDCPKIDPAVLEKYGDDPAGAPSSTDPAIDQAMEDMKQEIGRIDLDDAARRTGGRFEGGKLTIKVLGKDFSVDREGNLSTQIHVNRWVAGPFLAYVLHCKDTPLADRWVPMRELDGGKDWFRLFNQRCEKPMKQVADRYPDLFSDMVDIFAGKPVEKHYQSDVSLVLHPLPRMPVLVCYWKPDEGMPSDFNLFFDASAEERLPVDFIFTLGAGLSQMFGKLANRHGY